MNRRDFLRSLVASAATVAAGVVVAEPVRRIWQVSRNAPIGWLRVGSSDLTFTGLEAEGRAFRFPEPMSGSVLSMRMQIERDRERLYAAHPTLTFADDYIERSLASRKAVSDAEIDALWGSPGLMARIRATVVPLDTLPMLREVKTREELAALYEAPDPSAPFRFKVL